MLRQCNRCGEERSIEQFYRYKNGRVNSWCKPCYRDWYAERSGGLTERQCDWCGVTMSVTKRRASEPRAFCSRECKDQAWKAKQQQERLESKPRLWCLHCGGEMPQAMRIDARFCSEQCNSSAHAVTRKMAKRARQQRFDVGDGLVSRAEIAMRDGWRCGICGGQVAQWREHPDPLAPSIDHSIPLARGGGNDAGNLQLVHLRCNLRKRAG